MTAYGLRISDGSSDVCSSDLLTSSTIGYEEMLRIGYLDEVHDSDRLDTAIDVFINRLLHQAPVVSTRMKHVLNAVARQQFDEAYARDGFDNSLTSSDIKDGLAAWADKRTQIGRTSGRERVCKNVYISVEAGTLKNKKTKQSRQKN